MDSATAAIPNWSWQDWWLSLIPALALTALAVVARKQQGNWTGPGAFFALTWSVLVWVPILLLPDVPPYAPAVAWIATTAAVVFIGTYFGAAFPSRVRPVQPHHWRALNALIVACTLGGLATVGLLLHSKGAGPSALLSLQELEGLGSAFSTDRYRHLADPTGPKYLVVSIYLGGLFGGLRLAASERRRDLLVAVLPLVPAVLISVVEATRAAILFPLVLMVSSYLATRVVISRGRDSLFTWRRILVVVFGVASLLMVSLAVLALRYESAETHANLANLLGRVRLDSFGYLAVWSAWFSHGGWIATAHPALGYYSFGGFFDFLHLRARIPGVYSDPVSFGATRGTSNIFTMFRGAIQDFTASGALVAFCLMGAVAGGAYSAARAGHARATPILAAFYAMTLWSFVVDIFSYNTIVVAWLIYAAYVAVEPSLERIGTRGSAAVASAVGQSR